eukprot:15437358-Alexandrium_andersonii.AAC.1
MFVRPGRGEAQPQQRQIGPGRPPSLPFAHGRAQQLLWPSALAVAGRRASFLVEDAGREFVH